MIKIEWGIVMKKLTKKSIANQLINLFCADLKNLQDVRALFTFINVDSIACFYGWGSGGSHVLIEAEEINK